LENNTTHFTKDELERLLAAFKRATEDRLQVRSGGSGDYHVFERPSRRWRFFLSTPSCFFWENRMPRPAYFIFCLVASLDPKRISPNPTLRDILQTRHRPPQQANHFYDIIENEMGWSNLLLRKQLFKAFDLDGHGGAVHVESS
jgi:hypothetical protein